MCSANVLCIRTLCGLFVHLGIIQLLRNCNIYAGDVNAENHLHKPHFPQFLKDTNLSEMFARCLGLNVEVEKFTACSGIL